MAHMFARLINSCKPEHELRNVQPQIKGISKSIDTFHKDLLGTVREIGRWQIHQEPPIQNYLSTMAQFEEEIAAASVEYTEGYSRFAEFWDAVLEEHKSLQDTEKQHDKAVKVLEKQLGKKIKAETQDEINEVKVADETVALSDAQSHEQELRNRLHVKMLGYEKNLHRNLRMAYYILHIARLDYYRKCTDISQRAIEAIGTLQDVREIKEFEFLYEPFNEPINEMARPYWSYEQPITSITRQAIRQDLGASQGAGASGGPATPSQKLVDFYASPVQFPPQQPPAPLQQLLQQQPVPPLVQAQVLPSVPQLPQQAIFHPDEAIQPQQVQQLQQQLLQQPFQQQSFQQQPQQQQQMPMQQQQQPQQQQQMPMQQLEQQQPHPPQALLQQIHDLGQQQPSRSQLQPQQQQMMPQQQQQMPQQLQQQQQPQQMLLLPVQQQQPLQQQQQPLQSEISKVPDMQVQQPQPIPQTFGQGQDVGNIGNMSSNPASATDKPSEIFGGADMPPMNMNQGIGSSQMDQPVNQFGDAGESSVPSVSKYNPDMGSGLDTGAGMPSQHEANNPDLDFTPLYKPSEVMHMQKLQQKPAMSSSLNPPSYMNPPSSSMNPDYSSGSKVSDVDSSIGNKPSSDVGMTTTRTGETTF